MSVVIVLISLAVILFIIFIVALIVGFYILSKDGGDGGETLPQCSNYVNPSSLTEIPVNYPKCINGTNIYYIGTIDPDNDFVVAPWITPINDVCVQFCDTYINNVCNGNEYNGLTAQENYDNCISKLTLTECNGTPPIAILGTTLYYPYSPTCNVCDSC